MARLLTRHFAAGGSLRAVRWRAMFDLNATTLLIVHVALVANLAPIRLDDPDGAGFAIDDSRRRPVSLTSIALSMNVPHETIRRQAFDLQRRGILQKVGRGWIVPAALMTAGPGKALVAADTAALVAIVGDLARLGSASAQGIAPVALRALPPDLVARLWNEFCVLTAEVARELCGSMLDFSLFMAIIRMNVEHINADPERTRRHAAPNAIPADSDRLPASLRALARAEQLPYPTVRRRVSALVTRGLVENVEEGVIVPARVHGSELMVRNSALYIQRIEKLLADLKRLCGDAARPRAVASAERLADRHLPEPTL
ncbi:MAG: hypothetical protein ACOYO0_07535 [Sandarakinorhabdus sp.]